jgi:hypothetical protein
MLINWINTLIQSVFPETNMQRLIIFGFSALLVVATIGCGGSDSGRRATEGGAMSIEEYEQQAAAEEGAMNAMPEEAKAGE